MVKRNLGFTLYELLIVLSIMAIVSTVAVPTFSQFSTSIHTYNAINALRSAIRHARSEAITQNKSIALCASSDGIWCNPEGAWEQGWITYINNSNQSTRNKEDPVILRQSSFKKIKIRKNGREKSVKFNGAGRVGLNRSFSICSSQNQTHLARLVIVHSGRVRVDFDPANCI